MLKPKKPKRRRGLPRINPPTHVEVRVAYVKDRHDGVNFLMTCEEEEEHINECLVLQEEGRCDCFQSVTRIKLSELIALINDADIPLDCSITGMIPHRETYDSEIEITYNYELSAAEYDSAVSKYKFEMSIRDCQERSRKEELAVYEIDKATWDLEQAKKKLDKLRSN